MHRCGCEYTLHCLFTSFLGAAYTCYFLLSGGRLCHDIVSDLLVCSLATNPCCRIFASLSAELLSRLDQHRAQERTTTWQFVRSSAVLSPWSCARPNKPSTHVRTAVHTPCRQLRPGQPKSEIHCTCHPRVCPLPLHTYCAVHRDTTSLLISFSATEIVLRPVLGLGCVVLVQVLAICALPEFGFDLCAILHARLLSG